MMDDDNLIDDLDVNQELSNRSLETTHEGIEDRIQHLDGVVARETRRQERNYIERWRSLDAMVVNGNNISNRGFRRNSSRLVANALQMDSPLPVAFNGGGSFYGCNICLEEAREPVVTCCGHLFCWGCFYQLSYVDSGLKECPVCKGEVSDRTIIPIYGNGPSEGVRESESGLKIPPRPKAPRVESVRQQQQRVSRGRRFNVPVSDALRRTGIIIGSTGRQSQQEEGSNGWRSSYIRRIYQVFSAPMINGERVVVNPEGIINNRLLVRNDAQALYVNTGSRVTGHSGDILSSSPPRDLAAVMNADTTRIHQVFSSHLDNGGGLVVNIEGVIGTPFLERNDAQTIFVRVGAASTGHSSDLHSNNLPQDLTADINTNLPVNSSPVASWSQHSLRRRNLSRIYNVRRRSSLGSRRWRQN